MQIRKSLFPGLLILASGGFVVFSLSRGQDRSAAPVSAPAKSDTSPAGALPPSLPTAPQQATRDFSKLPPLQQQMYLSAQRGADWLCRTNQTDGRFLHGYLPALKAPLEGDHYLRQAGAAFALARVARFLGQESYAAVARQAVLTLLLETTTDPQDPHARHTTLPPLLINPLGAAGLLILAIHELPSPGEDLLEQAEQLCVFIRKQQRTDGALDYAESGSQAENDPDGINYYPGEALYGLMRSQQYRPAAWKTEIVRKALPYYRSWWRTHKSLSFVPWQTAAYAEAYLLTREQPFADFVLDMNDWVCGFQHIQLDPHHPLWLGGFRESAEGSPMMGAPQVTSACYAEGLAEACRVARQAGDRNRYQRYREALELCLQFLTTLQYTEANTQHFADWYRPVLVGAFHASHQDGNLRIDYTQHAVSALVQYLVSGEW
jgi:hypothetical protein